MMENERITRHRERVIERRGNVVHVDFMPQEVIDDRARRILFHDQVQWNPEKHEKIPVRAFAYTRSLMLGATPQFVEASIRRVMSALLHPPTENYYIGRNETMVYLAIPDPLFDRVFSAAQQLNQSSPPRSL